ncbi:MAG: ATP-dependent sacrificial sulfur transferase LarE [Gracilibacteraceae bacterium]|nr:ATP-dependent sacrificial sulfur transferase LarE [Gracilibacteraceae bacterium]
MRLEQKEEKLKEQIRGFGSLAVAFSGGADSTYLLYTARAVLGPRVLAVTARSCSFPARELEAAAAFCAGAGIEHVICDSEELAIDGFAFNPPNRCYLCKNELFGKIWKIAAQRGIKYIADGSNLDDEGDYRPGLTAAAEQGVQSPLRRAGLTKADIRELSRRRGLPTWDKPSFACLASRFPYGEQITAERLRQIDLSEQFLLDLGFRQVRVRYHGGTARLETDEAGFSLLHDRAIREKVYARLREIGFTYAAVDLLGYRSGSMNDTLPEGEAARG